MMNMHTTTIPTDDDDKPIDDTEIELPTKGKQLNRHQRQGRSFHIWNIRKNLPALPSWSIPIYAWKGFDDIWWQAFAWQARKLSFSACHGQ